MESICFDKIRGMHLEITSKCNANCAMCGRNYKGKFRENIKFVD